METSSRRKACDLCFKKKIRCDALKPTCSNCSLYKVSCKTTTVRKRPGLNYKQPSIAPVEADAVEVKKDGGLDARLARIEAKLDALRGIDSTVTLDHLLEQDASDERAVEISSGSEIPYTPASAHWINPRDRDGPPVPPLTEALPVIESYFRDYNSLIPLFNQQSFMRLLNDYYKPYGERPKIYAGVINVVLAMGYRIQLSEHGDVRSRFNEAKIKTCVDNAQIMLDELMTRDQDTLGLQALLGLELSPQEARQRANIFWLCYMLDKDVSLRTITPSLQLDSDIDIDLPGVSSSDDCGNLLYSVDGLSQLHLFRAKVQLAHLEGKIYDTLLSNRSRKLSDEAREQAVLQIDRLLERWKQSIPAPLQLENMAVNLLSGPLIHMTVLYQTYLMCLTMTHGLYAHNSPWLKALGGLGSDLLRTFNPRGSACMDGSASSTPAIWENCVTASRAILNILSYHSFGGCSVWLSACAYFSAMTFLFVNLIYHPTSKLAENDQKLAELSMLQLQKYFDYKGLEKFKQLRHVLVQIGSMAESVLEEARASREPKASAQPKPPFEPASFSSTPPPLIDVFDMTGQDLTSEQPVPTVGLGWMGATGFGMGDADLAAYAWRASGAEPFFGFGPS
ncbi:hypothetical protein F4782DRAFT_531663 [Xylaria castorea]|nr:hypothetical protein F4782DRAFT_531663 [Xylaria castorea]